jgi:methylmalonyl-CoA decarboxylase subunit alpha
MGIIEEIISPRETRKRVVAILDAFKDKTQIRLPKKHNNIPL